VTHTTFQKLLLTPFNVHEILGFEILSSDKHFCHWEISEILLTVKGLDLWELTSFPKQKPYTPEMFQEGSEIIDQHERDKKPSRDNTP